MIPILELLIPVDSVEKIPGGTLDSDTLTGTHVGDRQCLIGRLRHDERTKGRVSESRKLFEIVKSRLATSVHPVPKFRKLRQRFLEGTLRALEGPREHWLADGDSRAHGVPPPTHIPMSLSYSGPLHFRLLGMFSHRYHPPRPGIPGHDTSHSDDDRGDRTASSSRCCCSNNKVVGASHRPAPTPSSHALGALTTIGRASPRASLGGCSPACRVRLFPSHEHAAPGVRIAERE